jgi:hypothetical protein
MPIPSAARALLGLPGLFLGAWLVSASVAEAGAADIEGVWASNAAACKDIFAKSERSGVSFSTRSDAFGSGLVIDGGRIREKSQHCRIVRRNQKGDTIHLLASCSSDVSADAVRFGLRLLDDDHIVRSFPGITDLELTYERCHL